jgi:hypothetical protein
MILYIIYIYYTILYIYILYIYINRDAARIHVAAAEFIERKYARNLRPFYTM